LLVEGIGPQGKREKIGIIVFQMLHIIQPLMDQLPVSLFSFAKQAMNYQGHKQNLEKDEGDVSDQINEDMVGISENQIVHKIDNCREYNQDDTQFNLPAPSFHSMLFYINSDAQCSRPSFLSSPQVGSLNCLGLDFKTSLSHSEG